MYSVCNYSSKYLNQGNSWWCTNKSFTCYGIYFVPLFLQHTLLFDNIALTVSIHWEKTCDTTAEKVLLVSLVVYQILGC